MCQNCTSQRFPWDLVLRFHGGYDLDLTGRVSDGFQSSAARLASSDQANKWQTSTGAEGNSTAANKRAVNDKRAHLPSRHNLPYHNGNLFVSAKPRRITRTVLVWHGILLEILPYEECPSRTVEAVHYPTVAVYVVGCAEVGAWSPG